MAADKAGESVQQLRRVLGHARRSATPDDMGAELADVPGLVVAYAAAQSNYATAST